MIIGLTGYEGAGKDTVADILAGMYGLERYAFADPLKDAACSIMGWTRADLANRAFYEKMDTRTGVVPRRFVRWLGTEVMRDYYPLSLVAPIGYGRDHWVKLFLRKYNSWKDYQYFRGVVVSDVRFQNEADAIYEKGGFVFRVENNRIPAPRIEHSSQDIMSLKGITGVIPNHWDLETLRYQLPVAMTPILGHLWQQPDLDRIR